MIKDRSSPKGRHPSDESRRKVVGRRIVVAAALMVAVVVGAPVLAQDMTGTWELSSQTPRGTRVIVLSVVQDGSVLTGTLTMARGGRGGGGGGGSPDGAEPTPIEITDGQVTDGDFSFVMSVNRGGNTVALEFTGRFEGEEMSGMIEGGRGGGPFTGNRSD